MNATDPELAGFDLRPAYYDDFHCLAGDCRLSCCKGWHIPFDRKDYMRLKGTHGTPELNQRIADGLHRLRSGPSSEAFFAELRVKEEDEDCPLHCEDGLCLLQLEKGHEALPEVCRQFPRQKYVCSAYLERALSPACEGVLALLWDLPEGVDFRIDALPRAAQMNSDAVHYGAMETNFQEIRSRCIDILQDRRTPLPQRMMLLGMALKKLVDGETDLERWLSYVQQLTDQVAVEGITLVESTEQSLGHFLLNSISLLRSFHCPKNLAPIRESLLSVLDFEPSAEKAGRVSVSLAPYVEARARYEERFAGREYFMENLMVSLFFQLRVPTLDSAERLWRSYVDFCNLYGFYRFLAVMSCREGAAGDRDELFRMIVFGSRKMIHNRAFNEIALDSLYKHDSASLAHMAVLLGN